MTQVSSRLTFFYKVMFPATWSSFFGLGTLLVFGGGMRAPSPGGVPPLPAEMPWIFLLAWALGTGVLLLVCVPLKRVEVRGSKLVVSNYRHEIQVALSEVAEISERRWFNPRAAIIRVRRETALGSEFVVMLPTQRWMMPWTEHPVVSDLQARVNQAKEDRLLRFA